MVITPYTGGKRKTDNLQLVVSPMPTETFQKLAAMPGFKQWDGWKLIFRPVVSNVQYIKLHWPEAKWMEGTDSHLALIEQLAKDANRVIQMKAGPLPPMSKGGYQYKRLPRDHQRRALLVSWHKKYFALLMEQRCVDSETEYLSPSGWIKISEYKGGKVAQWHAEDSGIDFVDPIRYIKAKCSEMIHFKNKHGVDQMLSPEHNMPIYIRPGRLEERPASVVADEYLRQVPGFKHRSLPAKSYLRSAGPGLPISDAALRIQIALMADGTFPKEATKSKRVYLKIKRPRKIARLRKLLADAGIEWSEKPRSTGYVVFGFQAPIKTKRYDSRFWECSLDQIKIICDEVFYWDGSHRATGARGFFSVNQSDIDFIQYCLVSTGEICRSGKNAGKLDSDMTTRGTPLWGVSTRVRGDSFHLGANPKTVTRVKPPDGFKYCFEVPSGYLLLRRNGCVFPTGNCGKTKVIIDNIAHLWNKKLAHTLVIVTLNGVHRNWVEYEIPEDLPDWVPREAFFIRPGHNKQQQKRFETTLAFKEGLRVFAFNFEGLSREGSNARSLFEQAIGDGKGVMLAIDESSDGIKTYDSKRTKYILKMGGKAEYRRILTGTQSPEGKPDELFPQYKFLDEDILGYDTITTFRAHFCQFAPIRIGERQEGEDMRPVRELIVPGCKHVEELRGLIEGHSFRVRRSDCMDLPPKVYKRWPVELSAEQRRIYDELKEEYTTAYKSSTMTAALAMTRWMRLQQVICGWFPMDEPELLNGETWRTIRKIGNVNPRMDALDDILRTNDDEKVIIWSRFRPDLDAIQKHLGTAAVSYHGGVKDERKATNERAFKESKSIRYMISNPASGLSRGHNLSFATLSVYYANSFRLVDRLQSEDRTEGNEQRRESTLVIDIEAAGTVDTRIIKRLRLKKDLADLINGDPKSLFMEEA